MFAQPRHDRRRLVGMAALSLAAAWIGTRDSVMQLITVKPFQLSSASDLASLGRATAWLNSAPLTAADLGRARFEDVSHLEQHAYAQLAIGFPVGASKDAERN